MKKFLVKYDSNNSGGSWWLSDKDWKNLEKAGWFVVWATYEFDWKNGNYQYDKNGLPKIKKSKSPFVDKKGRYLGALAKYAFKRFDGISEALQEFETITGQNVSDEGCNCCGAPHSFSWKSNDGEHEYCSGEDCLKYLFPDKVIPTSLREAIERD